MKEDKTVGEIVKVIDGIPANEPYGVAGLKMKKVVMAKESDMTDAQMRQRKLILGGFNNILKLDKTNMDVQLKVNVLKLKLLREFGLLIPSDSAELEYWF